MDGGWTEWGSYTLCTTTCGPGTHFRERYCTNPRPANGGKQCPGSANETSSCYNLPCPTTLPQTTASRTPLAPGNNLQDIFCVTFKGTSYILRGGNYIKVVFASLLKGVYSKRKEFAPPGSKFFSFRIDPFSEGT